MTDPVAPVPPAAPAAAPVAAGPKQALSLTAFICGLGGVLFSAIPGLGFLASLAGIILGAMSRKREPAAPKWMPTVGIIAGIVGLILSLVFTFVEFILPFLLTAATIGTIPYTN